MSHLLSPRLPSLYRRWQERLPRPLRARPLRLVPLLALLGGGALPCHWVPGLAGGAEPHAAHAQASAPAQEIKVSLREWTLTPARIQVPFGQPLRFVAANDGVLPHALAVEGAGLYAESDAIGSHETLRFEVNVPEPGVYDLYCPVAAGQHRALGQEGLLVVGDVDEGIISLPPAEDAGP